MAAGAPALDKIVAGMAAVDRRAARSAAPPTLPDAVCSAQAAAGAAPATPAGCQQRRRGRPWRAAGAAARRPHDSNSSRHQPKHVPAPRRAGAGRQRAGGRRAGPTRLRTLGAMSMCVEGTWEGADGENQECNGAGRAGGATMPMQPPAVHDAGADLGPRVCTPRHAARPASPAAHPRQFPDK